MECSPDLEELLRVVFKLKSREVDVLMTLCGGEMTVEELSDLLDLDRSTTQNYVSALRKTGLLERSKEGRRHVYSVNSETLRSEAFEKLEAWTQNKRESIREI
jgi:CRISPR locus-related DNA-binding protein